MKLKDETNKLPVCAQISVRAIIIEDGKVLMVEHEHTDKRGKFWIFPGGGVEEGETIPDAAIRETEEETGIIVKSIGVAHVREAQTLGQRAFEIYVVCKKIGGILKVGSDPEAPELVSIIDTRWFSADELNEILYYPETLWKTLPDWVKTGNVPIIPLPAFKVVER